MLTLDETSLCSFTTPRSDGCNDKHGIEPDAERELIVPNVCTSTDSVWCVGDRSNDQEEKASFCDTQCWKLSGEQTSESFRLLLQDLSDSIVLYQN